MKTFKIVWLDKMKYSNKYTTRNWLIVMLQNLLRDEQSLLRKNKIKVEIQKLQNKR